MSCVHLVVMLCGGRACEALSSDTIEHVKLAVKAGHHFVVGDCYGADVMFQDILNELGASYTVYHIGYSPRNNPHNAQSKRVLGNRYTDKDDAMRGAASTCIHEPQGAGRGTMASVRYFN